MLAVEVSSNALSLPCFGPGISIVFFFESSWRHPAALEARPIGRSSEVPSKVIILASSCHLWRFTSSSWHHPRCWKPILGKRSRPQGFSDRGLRDETNHPTNRMIILNLTSMPAFGPGFEDPRKSRGVMKTIVFFRIPYCGIKRA